MNNDGKRVVQGATTISEFFNQEKNEKTFIIDNEYFVPEFITVKPGSPEEKRVQNMIKNTTFKKVRRLKPFWRKIILVAATGATLVATYKTFEVIIDKLDPIPIEQNNDKMDDNKVNESLPGSYEQSIVKIAREQYQDFDSLSDDEKYNVVVRVENDLMNSQEDNNKITR